MCMVYDNVPPHLDIDVFKVKSIPLNTILEMCGLPALLFAKMYLDNLKF